MKYICTGIKFELKFAKDLYCYAFLLHFSVLKVKLSTVVKLTVYCEVEDLW